MVYSQSSSDGKRAVLRNTANAAADPFPAGDKEWGRLFVLGILNYSLIKSAPRAPVRRSSCPWEMARLSLKVGHEEIPFIIRAIRVMWWS